MGKAVRKLVGMRELLADARRQGYAVGAFNFANAESAQAVVEQAVALRAPVILMTGPWEIPMLGAKLLAQIARELAAQADVPVCLHLDHAADLGLVEECIGAGFPSVMMDASAHDFEENVRLTRAVVELAHPRGITVEAELGAVGRVADGLEGGSAAPSLTDPEQAAEYVARTGVDALAVAIGNAHGIYPQCPQLDFDRLGAVARVVTVPLVLHGGSGTPADQLARAIALGVGKVNVASEVSRAYIEGFTGCVAAAQGRTWYAYAMGAGKQAVGQVAARWMKVLGAEGRA